MLAGLIHLMALGQCNSFITIYPYMQSFETNDGGWMDGGIGSDWEWGNPNKAVIQGAASGNNCWITGGLTGTSYNNAEASWLRSPCFDFSSLQAPYLTVKLFWETEQQFDGASLQYSTDDGNSWSTLGSANEAPHCLNDNWFNQSPVTYLSAITNTRDGWSGNIQPSSGSCRGGNGSNGWVTATHIMPFLAGKPSVIFRFIFGAGTICNNYDGFAFDDFEIKEAPSMTASFDQSCTESNTVNFTNTSDPCLSQFNWNFGDPASGNLNSSLLKDPVHRYSGPGTYTIKLTASAPGINPSITTREITILDIAATIISPAECELNSGGSAKVEVAGSLGPFDISWNSIPVQTGPTATGLKSGTYSYTVAAPGACTAVDSIIIPLANGCGGIFFPSAFTPNGDGRNDGFGVLGSIANLSAYRLMIYNRWGELVFQTRNPLEKWNGTFKNIKEGNSVFVWKTEFSLQGQPIEKRTGTVMILR